MQYSVTAAHSGLQGSTGQKPTPAACLTQNHHCRCHYHDPSSLSSPSLCRLTYQTSSCAPQICSSAAHCPRQLTGRPLLTCCPAARPRHHRPCCCACWPVCGRCPARPGTVQSVVPVQLRFAAPPAARPPPLAGASAPAGREDTRHALGPRPTADPVKMILLHTDSVSAYLPVHGLQLCV